MRACSGNLGFSPRASLRLDQWIVCLFGALLRKLFGGRWARVGSGWWCATSGGPLGVTAQLRGAVLAEPLSGAAPAPAAVCAVLHVGRRACRKEGQPGCSTSGGLWDLPPPLLSIAKLLGSSKPLFPDASKLCLEVRQGPWWGRCQAKLWQCQLSWYSSKRSLERRPFLPSLWSRPTASTSLTSGN